MKGFELNINGQIKVAALDKGNVSIITSRTVKNENEITNLIFSGLNYETNERFEWYRSSLDIGDEFTVKVIDVSNNSEPIKTEIVKPNSLIIEGKLRAYNSLKKELETLGVI